MRNRFKEIAILLMFVALSCSSPKEKVNPEVLDLSPEQVSQWSDDIDFFQSLSHIAIRDIAHQNF